ncbi:TPA: glycosyltransferase [Photobacterium damselae]
MPKVSIVLPVFNAEDYVKEAIESVLNQTFRDFELIIINDGSTDNSSLIINKIHDKRIVYIEQENKGLSKSLNLGISKARGTYIARMDADDICMPDRLLKQVEVFEKNPDIAIVCGNVIYINSQGVGDRVSLTPSKDKAIRFKLKKGNVIFHPSTMFRLNIYNKTRGYDENINCYIEDYILWLQILEYGNIFCIKEPILKYRVLDNSISRSLPYGMDKVIRKVASEKGYYSSFYDEFNKALENEKMEIIKDFNVYGYKINNIKRRVALFLYDIYCTIRYRVGL